MRHPHILLRLQLRAERLQLRSRHVLRAIDAAHDLALPLDRVNHSTMSGGGRLLGRMHASVRYAVMLDRVSAIVRSAASSVHGVCAARVALFWIFLHSALCPSCSRGIGWVSACRLESSWTPKLATPLVIH